MDLQVLTGLASAKEFYLDAVRAAVPRLKEELVEAVKEAGIPALKWQQFTPYFNDGDECVFTVYSPYIVGNPADDCGDGIDVDYSDPDYVFNSEYHKEAIERLGLTREQYVQIRGIWNLLETQEDLLKEAFGDHVEVTVTADGITTEGYDHD